MNIFLFGRETSKLYNETTPSKLALQTGFTFTNTLKHVTPKLEDVLIRYGKYDYPLLDVRFGKVLNHSVNIKHASDKLYASLLFLKKGIRTPEVILDKRDITKEKLPVLRRLKHHSRGSDIKYISSMDNIVDGDYYSVLVKGSNEYRVHVFNGEVIRVQKKIRESGEGKDYLHNFENGFLLKDTFKHDLDLENKMLPLAVASVQCLGLLFGAVDVLVEDDTQKCYVLEVNTAPRLNKFGRQLYALYLFNYLKKPYDINLFTRIKVNAGKESNGLPVYYREILVKKKDDET